MKNKPVVKKEINRIQKQMSIDINLLNEVNTMLNKEDVYYNSFSDLIRTLLINEISRYKTQKQILMNA